MNKLHKRGKRILVMVLVFAILCTSLPSTVTFGLFTQIQPIHAAAEEQQVAWYKITTKINSSWGGHISGEITITNNSSQPRQDWQIALSWQAQITSMWNGRYQQSGHSYLITPMEYNTILQPNASVSIGLLAEGDDTILDSLVSENFLTESGAEITDAEQRASQTDQPQTMPTPGAVAVPTAESTQTPSAIMETPVPTHPFTPAPTAASPTETPIVVTEEPVATVIPAVDTPEPAATVTPAVTPTITPVQTSSPEPTASLEPVYPDWYLTSGITLQENTTCGSLYILSGGYVNLNGYTLTIQKDIRIHTDRNAFTGRGVVRLEGNLIQSSAAASGSLHLDDSTAFILCGSQSQTMELAYLETSYLGRLDLSGCQEAHMPEEIHCYSLSGIRNLYAGETLRLGISRFSLDSDLQIPGNLILLDGYYQTGGYQIEIGGNLEIQGKSIDLVFIEGGKMTIHGETHISGGMLMSQDGAEVKSDGDIHVTSGSLKPLSGGTVETGGNFLSETGGGTYLSDGILKIDGNWEISGTSHKSNYIKGEIQLKGDLIQQEEAGLDSFNLEDRVIFKLKGSAPQHIDLNDPENTCLGQLDLSDSVGVTFEDSTSYSEDTLYLTGVSLDNLEKIKNKGSLCLEFDNIYLEDDLDYPGDLECQGNLIFNSHDMTIRGDLEMAGNLSTPGTLDIYGNYTAVSGTTDCGTGTIRVRKNFRLKETASLYMREAAAKLLVEGDFKTSATGTSYLSAGTIELKGDLIQTVDSSDRSLEQTGTHFLFSGSEKQMVILGRREENTHFQYLDLRESAGVTFTSGCLYANNITGWDRIDNSYLVVCNARLIQQQPEVFHGSLTLINSALDCNGQVFQVEDGVELSDSDLVLNQGIFISGGDFSISGAGFLMMRQEKDQLVVQGDFQTASTFSHSGALIDGRMELHGDFNQAGHGASFAATDNHLTVFAGEEPQAVHFEDKENSHFAKVIVSGAGYYTDDETETKVLGVSKNILLGMEDGLEEFIEASVVGLPLAIAIDTVGEVTGTGHIIIVGAAAYFVGMLAADAIITADGDGNMYQKARQFGRDLILFLPTLLSVKEIPNAAGEVEELVNKSENVKAALQKLCNPKTYRQLLDHMKEAMQNESGSIDLSGSFRNLGKLRSALAKAETAEDAIRCCQEIIEEEAFQSLLKDHGEKDVAVVINYMKNLISAAEKAERKLTCKEADYITWSCDHGIAPETFLADVFLDRSTKPSGKPGGIPRGEHDKRKGRGYKGQNHAADVLADEGYDVEMLKEEHKKVDGKDIGNGYGKTPSANPDYLIENRVFDAYTPGKDTKLDSIRDMIKDKTKKQTDNIVIVMDYYERDVGELKNFLLGQTKSQLKHLRELKAIVNGKVETWFVR